MDQTKKMVSVILVQSSLLSPLHSPPIAIVLTLTPNVQDGGVRIQDILASSLDSGRPSLYKVYGLIRCKAY